MKQFTAFRRIVGACCVKGAAGALLAVTLAAPLPAAAQTVAEDRQTSLKFAQCIVEDATGAVTTALSENWDPTRYMLDLPRSKRSACIKTRTLPIDSPDLRYSLAIAYFDRLDIAAKAVDFTAVGALSQDTVLSEQPILRRIDPGVSRPDPEAERAKAEARKILLGVGECAVRTDPAAVRSLLANRADQELLRAVVPSVQACAPEGVQLAFSPDDLIGNLALNYVRLYLAAQAQLGTKPNA